MRAGSAVVKSRRVLLKITSVLLGERIEREQVRRLFTANLFYLKNRPVRKSFSFSFQIKECVKICHWVKIFRQARSPPGENLPAFAARAA